MSEIETTVGLETGDIITLAGIYKKRTVWQWLTLKHKQLERFRVIDTVRNKSTIEEV
jgi:hypothetical protein